MTQPLNSPKSKKCPKRNEDIAPAAHASAVAELVRRDRQRRGYCSGHIGVRAQAEAHRRSCDSDWRDVAQTRALLPAGGNTPTGGRNLLTFATPQDVMLGICDASRAGRRPPWLRR